MPAVELPHVFLPCWRDGRLLFFTDVKEGYTSRLSYRVAAATEPGSDMVMRTHKAAITPEQLEKCQATANDGAGLQRFFDIMGAGNLGHLVDQKIANLPPCAAESSHLIYACSYLNFLRKYIVDEEIVKQYEGQKPSQRFNPETALSIYKILSATLQAERASALIEADIPDILKLRGRATTIANLLREVSIVKFDAKEFSKAEAAMLQAVKLHDTEDKWRRLADISQARNQSEKAVDYFLKAEERAPLSPPPALRLATLLVEEKRFEEAKPFLERAEATFPKPVEKLYQAISA